MYWQICADQKNGSKMNTKRALLLNSYNSSRYCRYYYSYYSHCGYRYSCADSHYRGSTHRDTRLLLWKNPSQNSLTTTPGYTTSAFRAIPTHFRSFSNMASNDEDPPCQPLTFITGNANKLAEVRKILAYTVPSIHSIACDLPELQGPSTEYISIEKAKIAAKFCYAPFFVEDTSLCFTALNQLPGPYIKWFLDSLGHSGLNQMLAGFEDKSATALCVLSFVPYPNAEPIVFRGECKGKIVPARGPNTFGWDPIFEPEASDGKTFAEMDKEEKNKISHRAHAMQQLKDYLVQHREVLEQPLHGPTAEE